MSGNVIPLHPERGRPPLPSIPCPKHLSPEQARDVLEFAKTHGYSYERVTFAWMVVRQWWEVNQKKRKDWAAVTRNALLHFWGKQGFPDWMARRSWRGPEQPLTELMIDELVARAERREARERGD